MRTETVEVRSAGVLLTGDLAMPEQAAGVVLFAHGSGSSRHSPRNRAVAGELNRAGLGTLLLDLLTEEEERTDVIDRRHRFDIQLLTDRLSGAVDWLAGRFPQQPIGLFGASTGAAAALATAANRPQRVRAVVSRGGRPDLASHALPAVRSPVLLLVGERDEPVVEVNHAAASQLRVTHRVRVVPGASHLFEEPGAMEDVARTAAEWFRRMAEDVLAAS